MKNKWELSKLTLSQTQIDARDRQQFDLSLISFLVLFETFDHRYFESWKILRDLMLVEGSMVNSFEMNCFIASFLLGDSLFFLVFLKDSSLFTEDYHPIKLIWLQLLVN